MFVKSNIVAVHLFNDFSGSPKVLSTVIKNLVKRGYEVDLITSGGSEGALSLLPVNYKWVTYRFFQSGGVRLMAYFWSQLIIFMKIWAYPPSSVTVYVNTLLPFGAAIAARLRKQHLVYHLHETSLKPLLLKKFLKWVVSCCADHVVYVSHFLAKEERIEGVPGHVAYNALSAEFINKAKPGAKKKGVFNVLMLCSLKAYKGVEEFISLCNKLPHLRFELVLNADREIIDSYFKERNLPKNLFIYSSQKDVTPFYRRANLVLNLSKPDQWKETFGLTLLEGMQYGLPVIAPPAGGPCEIVVSSLNGYLIHPSNQPKLIEAIHRLSVDRELYQSMSHQALRTASSFTEKAMMRPILKCLKESENKLDMERYFDEIKTGAC